MLKNMGNALQEIFDHLKRHKLRTALTSFAVGWGVLLLIFLLGVGTGFRNGMEETTGSYSQADIRCYSWRTTKPYAGYEKGRTLYFDNYDIAIIKQAIPQVKEVYKTSNYYTSGTLRYGAKYYTDFTKIIGIEPSLLGRSIPINIKEGRALSQEDNINARHHYLLPETVAQSLFGKNESAVGKRIELDGTYGTVVGIYRVENKNDNTAIIYAPFREQELKFPYLSARVDELNLVLKTVPKNISELESLEVAIRQALSRRMKFDPTDESAVYINKWGLEGTTSLNNFFMGMNMFLWLVGISILSIGIVGVSNIMLVTVSERQREIGIRKALGARSKHIIGMILGESVIITILSGLIGLFIGVVLLLLLDYLVTVFHVGEFEFFGNKMHMLGEITISVGIGLVAVVVMAIAGLLAGYKPARKAVSIPAIEAMREQ